MSEYMPTVEDLVVAWTEVRLERSKRANAGECLAAARRAITAHDAELREEIAVEIETHLDAITPGATYHATELVGTLILCARIARGEP